MIRRFCLVAFFLSIMFPNHLYAMGFCGDVANSKNYLYTQDLLSHAGAYEGKLVEVIGIYYFSYPDSYLFATIDSYVVAKSERRDEKVEIRLNISKYRMRSAHKTSLSKAESGPKADGKVVKVRGVFHNRLVHGTAVALFIDEIQYFQICSNERAK